MENHKISKGSKILLWIFFVLLLFSIGAAFYQHIIKKDFDLFYDDYAEEGALEETEF